MLPCMVRSHTWSEGVWMVPWLEKLGLLGTPLFSDSCCCWFPPGTCVDLGSNGLGMDGVGACCGIPTFCCLGGFQAGGIWFWAGGAGVLGIFCWPGDILCTGGWGVAAIGCWDIAGESVRLLTGRGFVLFFIPARTYCTFTPDCTLRSWPSGKASLQRSGHRVDPVCLSRWETSESFLVVNNILTTWQIIFSVKRMVN